MLQTKRLESPIFESVVANYEIVALQSQDAHLREIRQDAFEAFKQFGGFPSIKNEEWRFTNVSPIIKDSYEVNAEANAKISAESLAKAKNLVNQHIAEILPALKGEHKGAYRIVNINGKLYSDLSFLPKDADITVLPILEATDQIAFQKHFGNLANNTENTFSAMNTALFTEGVFIEVKAGKHVDMPIHIINVYATAKEALMQPRNLYVVNEGANLSIIETEISDQQEQPVLVNALSEIFVAANAHFHHYDIQTGSKGVRSIQKTEATQLEKSIYSNYTYTFPGNEFVRNNLKLHLKAAFTESHLYGLYLTSGKQLVDNHTEVHHLMPNCESNQLYKGVALEKSHAVFNGKIHVYQDAQKTNAFQQSNNVVLSDDATINAKPQLEIYADDVKCSHGTTIGELDQDAIFYLQSRGISKASAENIMIKAFALDVTSKVDIPALANYLETLIEKEMLKIEAVKA